MTKICEEYLAVKGESDNFEEFDTMKLDETLGRFYMNSRGRHSLESQLTRVDSSWIKWVSQVTSVQQKNDTVKDSSLRDKRL